MGQEKQKKGQNQVFIQELKIMDELLHRYGEVFFSKLHLTVYHLSVNNGKSLDCQKVKERNLFLDQNIPYMRCREILFTQKLSGQERRWHFGRMCLIRRFHRFP